MARRRERHPRARSELKNLSYEIFIGVLSILSVVNLVLALVIRDPELRDVLLVMNVIFSIIFLIDFTYRITTAPSASRYFFVQYGWADLLASLPLAELKILRLFRVFRVIRLMRELGPRTIARRVLRDRANSALATLLLMGVLVLQYGSLAILKVEEHATGANITDASDALWYTIVTISTVGYGDRYPVTNAGRIIGSFIIIVGVGIFGTFTGYLANAFLGPGKSAEPADQQTDASSADATSTVPTHATAPAASAPAAEPVSAGAAEPATPSPPAPVPAAAPVDGSAAELAQLRELLSRSESALADSEAALAEMRGVLDAAG
ncbi:ion transporter [Microbacterium rhizosphaerae]|uniref:Ion transporter n=1 Tax=Microbacterium rhizosphaerae TaxID=1678237 RepID=A0ABZ0SQ66_9MICO|nr:ion transporter [Microbacterium rhizosphaerae]WPR89401.1 ion transporter [Microbacterium rhizosphaerae]